MDDGVEEIEALTVVDILRRAEIEIDMIAASEDRRVTGAHGIVIEADNIGNDVRFSKYDGVAEEWAASQIIVTIALSLRTET